MLYMLKILVTFELVYWMTLLLFFSVAFPLYLTVMFVSELVCFGRGIIKKINFIRTHGV